MENKSYPAVLKRRSDFQILLKKGHRIFPNSWLIVNYKTNDLGENRYGWTVPKFVGNAVARNRFKRWCREYVRSHKSELVFDKGIDINFVLRRKSKEFYKGLDHTLFDQSVSKVYSTLRSKGY